MKAAELLAPDGTEEAAAAAAVAPRGVEWGRPRPWHRHRHRHRGDVQDRCCCRGSVSGNVAQGGAVAETKKVGRSGWRERKAEIPIIAAMNGIGRRAEQKQKPKRKQSLPPVLCFFADAKPTSMFCSMRAYVARNRRPGCIRIGIHGLPFSRRHPSRRTLASMFQSSVLLSNVVFNINILGWSDCRKTLLILGLLNPSAKKNIYPSHYKRYNLRQEQR
jgi:hypothetical protein